MKGGDILGFLWPDEIPPAPFGKGGGVRRLAKEEIFWPLQKGEIFGPLGKGKIFRSYFRIVCRKGSHAGKSPKTAKHSPPLKKGGQGGFLSATTR
jgi:hypothetical protein